MKTPSQSSNRLTIGDQNSCQTPLSALPDLFGLEQALHDIGDEELKEGIKRLMMQQEEEAGVLSKKPVAWKTPFEVDAPRLAPIPRSPSPGGSVASEPDHLLSDNFLSEEQDAWAGIDELLECKSLDDSCAFSTSEILPRATVKAMRRDFSLGFLEEEPQEESEGGGSRTSKRSLESISRNSSNSSQSSRMKGNAASKSKTLEHESDAPPLVDSSDHEEVDDQLVELMSIIRRKQQGRAVVPDVATNSGNLFDMFHWSEKDNVDELRNKNTKLNRKQRKVRLLTPSMHKSSINSRSGHYKSNHESDTCSLPSLASFQDDDFTAASSTVDWESFHPKDTSSVVSESSREEFGGDEEYDDADDEYDTEENAESSTSLSLAGDGLVLDKGVDEYIRMIQKQLPTIVEDNVGSLARGSDYVDEITSPSPTSVTEESPFDELPTLASLSHSAHLRTSEKAQGKPGSRKMEEKKAPKPSLSFQLMSSIKNMKIKGKSSKNRVAAGDEEKYFPDAKEPEKSKVFKENRCLLGEGEDGDNWE
jgi:hypothetical protein